MYRGCRAAGLWTGYREGGPRTLAAHVFHSGPTRLSAQGYSEEVFPNPFPHEIWGLVGNEGAHTHIPVIPLECVIFVESMGAADREQWDVAIAR